MILWPDLGPVLPDPFDLDEVVAAGVRINPVAFVDRLFDVNIVGIGADVVFVVAVGDDAVSQLLQILFNLLEFSCEITFERCLTIGTGTRCTL